MGNPVGRRGLLRPLLKSMILVAIASPWVWSQLTPQQQIDQWQTETAQLYQEGKYLEGIKVALQAIALSEKTLGPEHPGTGTSLNNLAGLYRSQGKYAKAEPLYLRALSINEKALGAEHSETGASVSNLAALYESQGQYARAESLSLRALAIREKVLGPEHPETGCGPQKFRPSLTRSFKRLPLPSDTRDVSRQGLVSLPLGILLAACVGGH